MNRRANLARLRWLGGVAAVLVTLLLAQALLRTAPSPDDDVAPFLVAGRSFRPVVVGGLVVTVLGIRGAATVRRPDGAVLDTSGVWVILKVELMATERTTAVRYLALADRDGRTYRVSQRWRQAIAEGTPDLQPGLPVDGEVAFEVPRDAATHLTLRAGEHFDVPLGLRSRAVTDIVIPVEPGQVDQWVTDRDPAVLAAPAVVL
jgi:hypothetical protein